MPNRDVIVRHIDAMLADDPRQAMIALRAFTEHDLPWLERRTVREARRAGYSWARMGRLLGRSRQGLRQRFQSLDGTWEPLDFQPVEHGTKVMRRYRVALAAKQAEREFDQWAGGEAVPW
jgi:hypothetical protein